MKALFKRIAAAGVLSLTLACGDDKVKGDGGNMGGSTDFVSFVKGLIVSQTGDDTQPVAIEDKTFTDTESITAFDEAFFR